MIDHLSASQLQCYIDCSLKYKFNYIDKLPKPFRPSGLVLGSAIHAAIEWLHNQWSAHKEVSLEKVWDIFEADWYAQSLEPILFKDGEIADDVLNTGRNLLSIYFSQAPQNSVIHTEFSFKLPIVNLKTDETLKVPLVGFIDKIEEGDVVVDLKTWSRMISQDDLDGNLQLSAYAYAYWVMHRKNPLLRLDVLLKTKTPRFEQIETVRDEASHVAFFNLCKEVLNGIKKEVFFPNPSWKCRDCEYRDICWFWEK
jgi:putative RecB family exonuclease